MCTFDSRFVNQVKRQILRGVGISRTTDIHDIYQDKIFMGEMKLMKFKISLLAGILVCGILCCGCGGGREEIPEEPARSLEPETESFPDRIQEDISEHIRVDAECVYPQDWEPGTAWKAKMGEGLFWDRREELLKLFFGDKKVEKELSNEYDNSRNAVYYTDGEETSFYISTGNGFSFSARHSTHVFNALFSDDRFDSYNGDLYQKITDLPFLSQTQAWLNILEFLEKVGMEVSDSYTCFVMDHETMEQEEMKAVEDAASAFGKVLTPKEQWTEEDDCYCFKTRACWKGYYVVPSMTGEGYDEENVTVLYDKDGIFLFNVYEYLPLEPQEEVSVQPPSAVLEKVEKLLGDIISEDFYEIRQLTLCQKITGFDYNRHKGKIEPAWECKILIKNSQTDSSYIQKLYFNAETLEEL